MTPKRREKIERYIREASVDDLHEIQSLLNRRYRAMRVGARREALATLQDGDEAVLQNIKPKYLNGTRVRITGRMDTRLICRFTELQENLDPRAIRRFGLGSFRVPANCLKKVS